MSKEYQPKQPEVEASIHKRQLVRVRLVKKKMELWVGCKGNTVDRVPRWASGGISKSNSGICTYMHRRLRENEEPYPWLSIHCSKMEGEVGNQSWLKKHEQHL